MSWNCVHRFAGIDSRQSVGHKKRLNSHSAAIDRAVFGSELRGSILIIRAGGFFLTLMRRTRDAQRLHHLANSAFASVFGISGTVCSSPLLFAASFNGVEETIFERSSDRSFARSSPDENRQIERSMVVGSRNILLILLARVFRVDTGNCPIASSKRCISWRGRRREICLQWVGIARKNPSVAASIVIGIWELNLRIRASQIIFPFHSPRGILFSRSEVWGRRLAIKSKILQSKDCCH